MLSSILPAGAICARGSFTDRARGAGPDRARGAGFDRAIGAAREARTNDRRVSISLLYRQSTAAATSTGPSPSLAKTPLRSTTAGQSLTAG